MGLWVRVVLQGFQNLHPLKISFVAQEILQNAILLQLLQDEIKEIKHEKNELKEFKVEHFEKAQHKDLLPEKGVFEGPGKGVAEGPLGGPGGIGPISKGAVFEGTGSPEDRLAELEDAVSKLSHFIGVDLRPDLSSGALNKEPDVSSEAKPAEGPKPKAKPKRPSRKKPKAEA